MKKSSCSGAPPGKKREADMQVVARCRTVESLRVHLSGYSSMCLSRQVKIAVAKDAKGAAYIKVY